MVRRPMVGADVDPPLTAPPWRGTAGMKQIVLIGVSAGAAAALLFASIASGSLFALVLFYLAPLPILIAGIGWSHLAGAVAALFATLCVAIVLESYLVFMFVVAVALPAWWLGYLVLLARAPDGGPPGQLEWYPAGRIVLWAAASAAVAIAMAVPFIGGDAASFHATLKAFLETIEARLTAAGDLGPGKLFENIDLLVSVMPALVATLTTAVLLINTCLAARIVEMSGQLRRPWPPLSMITFPSTAPVILAVALAGMFLPGLPSVMSVVAAGALTMAFAVLGFAVLHVLTRNIRGRAMLLTAVYCAVIFFTWPVLILALLGLADTALDLRGRALRTGNPPTLH